MLNFYSDAVPASKCQLLRLVWHLSHWLAPAAANQRRRRQATSAIGKAPTAATLTIGSDGTGKYISASGSEKFEGVAIEVDEAGKMLKLKLLGVEVKKMTIDQAASGGQMKLDGVSFRSSNTTASSDKTTGNKSSDTKSSDTKSSDPKSSGDDKKITFRQC